MILFACQCFVSYTLTLHLLDGGEHWGTSLNNEAGEEQKRIPFVPNSGWIMNVDCYSWHSADTIECDMRRSVMVRFMTKVRNQ